MENDKKNPQAQALNKGAKGKKKKVNKVGTAMNTISYIILVLGVSLFISGFIILCANDVFALVKSDQTIMLEVPEKMSPSEMGKLLSDNEIIEHQWLFSIMSRLKKNSSYQSGKFEVSSNMDYGQIMSTLTRVPTYNETVMVTIPEGFSMAQIAKLMEDTRVCSSEEFLKTANQYEFAHDFLKDVPMIDNRLEGYLFPDTYEFYVNDKPVNVINKLLNTFDKKYTLEMRNLTKESGKSLNDLIIIASLIEKEAKLDDERSRISGVIVNRLAKPEAYPFLNIDATIMYATGHKDALTAEDLKLDTEYNTYTHKGLPPTAICSPGTSSILAAIMPEDNSYYYYVADPTDGSHVFSKNIDEHNSNVAKIAKKAKTK